MDSARFHRSGIGVPRFGRCQPNQRCVNSNRITPTKRERYQDPFRGPWRGPVRVSPPPLTAQFHHASLSLPQLQLLIFLSVCPILSAPTRRLHFHERWTNHLPSFVRAHCGGWSGSLSRPRRLPSTWRVYDALREDGKAGAAGSGRPLVWGSALASRFAGPQRIRRASGVGRIGPPSSGHCPDRSHPRTIHGGISPSWCLCLYHQALQPGWTEDYRPSSRWGPEAGFQDESCRKRPDCEGRAVSAGRSDCTGWDCVSWWRR